MHAFFKDYLRRLDQMSKQSESGFDNDHAGRPQPATAYTVNGSTLLSNMYDEGTTLGELQVGCRESLGKALAF